MNREELIKLLQSWLTTEPAIVGNTVLAAVFNPTDGNMKSCWITKHEPVKLLRTLIREQIFNNHTKPSMFYIACGSPEVKRCLE